MFARRLALFGSLAIACSFGRSSPRAGRARRLLHACRRNGAARWSPPSSARPASRCSMTRKSSGEFYAQLKAEAANPRGDIWWGGTGDPHLQAAEEGLTERIQVAEAGRAAGLGGAPVGAVEGPHGRHLCRRARLRLQHRAAQEEGHRRAEVLGRPAQARSSRTRSRSPTRTRRARPTRMLATHRAADGRGQGLRLPEGAAQERQPVHQVGRGAGQGGGHRRDDWSASRSSTTSSTHGGRQARRSRSSSPCEGTGYEIGSMSIIKGAKQPRQRQEVVRLGADRRRRRSSAPKAKSLPGAVEQERAGPAAGAEARRDQADRLRLRQVRLVGGAQAPAVASGTTR